MDAAAAIKANGVRIFAVGLQGEDFNQPLLAAVASDQKPSVLRRRRLTWSACSRRSHARSTSMSSWVGLREPVATQHFDLVAAEPAPDRVTATSTELYDMHADVLTAEQVQALDGFQYQVIPRQFGYYPVADRNSSLSFVACGAERVQQSLPPGPALLVLPPLPFTLGLPLLLLLLAGLPLSSCFADARRQRRFPEEVGGDPRSAGHRRSPWARLQPGWRMLIAWTLRGDATRGLPI